MRNRALEGLEGKLFLTEQIQLQSTSLVRYNLMTHPVDTSSLSPAFDWLVANGYLLMFIAMFIEGPIVTTIAAFAAAMGHFHIGIVVLLSFLGDFTSDLAHYAVGYFGRTKVIDRYRKNENGEGRLARLESHLKTHAVRGLVAIKFVPFAATLGLLVAGAIRMPFKTFAITVAITIAFRTVLFAGMGYFSGALYENISQSLQNVQYAILALILLGSFLPYLYHKFASFVAKKSGGIS